MTALRPEAALHELWQQRRFSLLQDRAGFAGLLSDICPSFYQERKLLGAALEHGVAMTLAAHPGVPLPDAERVRLVAQLVGKSLLQQSVCEWAVDAWAWALDRRAASPSPPAGSPTATLTVTPERIQVGEMALLSWDVRNADNDEVAIWPEGERFPAQWQWHVSPPASTTYVLTARQGSVETQETVLLSVEPRRRATRRWWKPVLAIGCLLVAVLLVIQFRFRSPVTNGMIFFARPGHLDGPGNVTLLFQAPGADKVEISPVDGCERRPSYWICRVESTTRFTLTAWRGGSTLGEQSVEVKVDQQ